jgi:hypothetical protein
VSDRRPAGFSAPLDDQGQAELYAERLRDGRIVLGSRRRNGDDWEPKELHLLDRPAALGLAGWLADSVEDAWLPALGERQAESIRTARDLYGDAADGAARLAMEMLREVSPALLRRALLLVANSIGPEARGQLVERLNSTTDVSEEAILRKRLAESQEALAYLVAAAALFDAIDRGLAGPAADLAETP